MNDLKTKAVGGVLTTILSALPADMMREILDDLFDIIENKIAATPTKWDDALVLPAIAYARRVLQIPDDIGGDED